MAKPGHDWHHQHFQKVTKFGNKMFVKGVRLKDILTSLSSVQTMNYRQGKLSGSPLPPILDISQGCFSRTKGCPVQQESWQCMWSKSAMAVRRETFKVSHVTPWLCAFSFPFCPASSKPSVNCMSFVTNIFICFNLNLAWNKMSLTMFKIKTLCKIAFVYPP